MKIPPQKTNCRTAALTRLLRKFIICIPGLALLLLVTGPLSAAPVPPTDNTSAPYMASFGNPLWTSSPSGWSNGINRGDFMASWLYRSGIWAEAFCGTDTWTNLAMPSFITTGAKNWLKQNPNGTLLITMGMFPTGADYTTSISGTTSTGWYTTAANRLVSAGLTSSTSNNVIVRLGHEFNAGFYSWHVLHSGTALDGNGNLYDDRPANYVALYQKIVTTMKAVAPNLKFCWNGANNTVNYPISQAYPGDAYVDYVATDVYDQAWLGTGTSSPSYPYTSGTYPYGANASTKQQNAWNNWIYPASPQNGILAWKNIAVAHGKPFGIGEWGLAGRSDGMGGMDNPYFIQQMYNFIQDPANGVVFHCYFDIHAGDGDHLVAPYTDQPPSAFPNASALFRQLFGMPLPVNADIGTVGVSGSNDPVTVYGAGAGYLTGTSDNFHFSGNTLSGDGAFLAQITAMSASAAAQSGIMLRQSTAANAPYAALFVANGQCIFQSRTSAGAAAVQNSVQTAGSLPVWLQIRRVGTTLTGYTSTDGVNWSVAGAQTVSMTGTNYIGMAVSSGSTTGINTTGIDNINNFDIAFSKTASVSNAIIVDNADASGIIKTGTWTSKTAPANYYGSDFLWVYHGSPVSTVKFTPTLPSAGDYDVYMNWATDMDRSTNVYTRVAYASGTTQLACNQYVGANLWNYLGRYNFASGTTGNVLLSSTGCDGYAVGADAVMFVPAPVATLPIPKVDSDIGSPTLAGSASYAGGVYTVTGAGTGLIGTSDQFHYVYQDMTGSQTLIARITGFTNTSFSAKAGVMMRSSLNANAAFMMTNVNPTGTVHFEFRNTDGSASSYSSASTGMTPSPATPVWVKMVKSGSTFTGYYSTSVTTPTTWNTVGSAFLGTFTNYKGGLGVTSAVSGSLATGIFDNVSP